MKLNQRSEANLAGVHPELARLIRATAEVSPLDFIVTEGLRTAERQAQLVKAGASKTMNSRHLTGHAVDLAVRVGDEIRWDGALYTDLAECVAKVASAEGVAITWGGAWVVIKPEMDLGVEQAKYALRKRRQGQRPLIDGPHFELDWKTYP